MVVTIIISNGYKSQTIDGHLGTKNQPTDLGFYETIIWLLNGREQFGAMGIPIPSIAGAVPGARSAREKPW